VSVNLVNKTPNKAKPTKRANDLVSPVSSPSKFQHMNSEVVKSQDYKAKPNPKAEKQKMLSLLVVMSTLVIEFLN
jgi:hypothetical protein